MDMKMRVHLYAIVDTSIYCMHNNITVGLKNQILALNEGIA